MDFNPLRRALCSRKPYVCTSCRLAGRRQAINTSFARWNSTSTATEASDTNATPTEPIDFDEAFFLTTKAASLGEQPQQPQTTEDSKSEEQERVDMTKATIRFVRKRPSVAASLKDASSAHLRTIARQVASQVASLEKKSTTTAKTTSKSRDTPAKRITSTRIKESIATLSKLKENPAMVTRSPAGEPQTLEQVAESVIAKLRESTTTALEGPNASPKRKASKSKKAVRPSVQAKGKKPTTSIEGKSAASLEKNALHENATSDTPKESVRKLRIRKYDTLEDSLFRKVQTTRKVKSEGDGIKKQLLRPRIKFDSVVSTLDSKNLQLNPLDIPQPEVPQVAYGLERVLFNPGVHLLQDPRSKVYNFDPYLQMIMPVAEFDFSALKEYITSSKDTTLTSIAKEHDCRYVGSTSSLSGLLSQLHFLISAWRRPTFNMLSKQIRVSTENFTLITRAASAAFLKWNGEHYAVDADKQFDDENILSTLGKSLEKLLTLPTDDYEKYRKSNEQEVSAEDRAERESYHYTVLENFLMRSQLDAYHPRLPGTGMFDLKTRAVLSVRHDVTSFEAVRDYEIRHLRGDLESYEKEYHDLIKNAFLKYSLQARMGRMDGIFLAYHNTQRIFGFQYVPLSDMDIALHGQEDLALGDSEFKLSMKLLKEVFDRATAKFPGQTLRFHMETRDASSPFMYIFAEPVTNEEMRKIQESNLEQLREFQARVLGVWPKKEVAEPESIDIDAEAASAEADPGSEVDRVVDEEVLHDHDENSALADQGTISTDEPQEIGQEVFGVEETLEDAKTDEIVASEAELDADAAAEQDITPEDLDQAKSASVDFEIQDESDESLTSETELAGDSTSEVVDSIDPASGVRRPANSNAADTRFLNTVAREAEQFEAEVDTSRPLLAMLLTVRNKVNGEHVTRPNMFVKPSIPSEEEIMNDWPQFTAADKWELDYSISTVEDKERAWKLYMSLQARRRKVLQKDDSGSAKAFNARRMRNLSKKGKQFREQEDARNKGKPIWVLGEDKPRQGVSMPAGSMKPDIVGNASEVVEEK